MIMPGTVGKGCADVENKAIIIVSSQSCVDSRCHGAYITHVYSIKLWRLMYDEHCIFCHITTLPVSMSSSTNSGEWIKGPFPRK